jgi:hypothetical protein
MKPKAFGIGSSYPAGILRTTLVFALTVTFLAWPALAADRVDPSTLTGKLIMGYQGWFDCPSDNMHLGWGHWGVESDGHFAATVDSLPDVSELPASKRCSTLMKTADGRVVSLYSAKDLDTVELHFAWLEKYGIAGIALQRFGAEIRKGGPVLTANNVVLRNVKQAAEDHARSFFVMYDLSGIKGGDLSAVIAEDWARLESQGLTRSPAYQLHRGHPLLALWGLGFGGRPISPADAEHLLDALATVSAPYGGLTFFGGVPTHWRTRNGDASDNPGWTRVWRRLGVISPWTVGRYKNDADADRYRTDVLASDMQFARSLGVDFMPVIFPGVSNANVIHRRSFNNQVPRECGRFYWRQVANALASGATMLYNAMFDEVNEGTAMFKMVPVSRDAPATGIAPENSFVTLDADGCNVPNDWYLRLAGVAANALEHHAKPLPELPIKLPAAQ